MQRQTIRTVLLIVLAVGMLAAVADPVVAESDQAVEILNIGLDQAITILIE